LEPLSAQLSWALPLDLVLSERLSAHLSLALPLELPCKEGGHLDPLRCQLG
jgi:hypothetical protein